MRIEFEGHAWDFDLNEITLKQGIAIKYAYGWNLNDWFKELENADAAALQCLYWLMLQQRGETIAIADADCPIMALADAFDRAYKAENPEGEEAEGEPDPTPHGSSPPASEPPPDRPSRARSAREPQPTGS